MDGADTEVKQYSRDPSAVMKRVNVFIKTFLLNNIERQVLLNTRDDPPVRAGMELPDGVSG